MKKVFITVFSAFSGVMVSAKELPPTITPASDAKITYVGRTQTGDDSVTFNWSGVYAKIKFEGNYLALKASDTKKNYFDIWIDRPADANPDKMIAVSGNDSLYVIVDDGILKSLGIKTSKPGTHSIVIKRRTEGEQGTTTFSEFVTKGQLLQAEGLKPRQFEVIGDSYTCGYGTENSKRDDPFKPETENCNLTYAAILSRYFDADYVTVAHSGMGIVRNYNDNMQGEDMASRYTQVFDLPESPEWSAEDSDFKPQISIIYLCTNDFSVNKQPSIRSFKSNYFKLLAQIKTNYGEDHPVLCMASNCDDMAADYVREVVNSCGLKNVYFISFTKMIYNSDDELGASWHPNYQAHIKLAHSIIPYVSTITGWEINDNIK